MLKTITLAALVLAVAGQAAAQTAAPPSFPALPPIRSFAEVQEANRVQTLRDQNACRTDAVKNGQVTAFYASPAAGGLAGAVVSGVIIGLASGATELYRVTALTKGCMAERGYHHIDFTPEQLAAVKTMKTAKERSAFYDVTPMYALGPDGAALRPAAYSYLDPQTRQAVAVHQDPTTGEVSRSWTVRP